MVLSKENNQLNLLTSIVPLVSKHPDVIAHLNYVKIDVDLRQTPRDIERVPNNTYVYLTYQTDQKDWFLERDFQIMAILRRLE